MIELVVFGLAPELKQSPLLPTVTEPIVVAQPPPEPTLEEKIASNYYQCDESIEWIRADNAQCLPKRLEYRASEGTIASEPISTPVSTKNTPQVAKNSSNTYAPGNCTYYAKSRRPDLPNNLGNANTWTKRASSQGIPTGTTPRAGAIGQKGMHVVYVESVNADGTFNLSEWNYRNLYEVTYRTVSSVGWSFIY